MAEKNFVYMTGLVAGGLQVWLLWDQKLYWPQSRFQSTLRWSHHCTKLSCSAILLFPVWYHIYDRIKNTQQLWVIRARKCERKSSVGTKVREEGGEKVLQALDQFPLQFMENHGRASVPAAAYTGPHSGSLASQEILPTTYFQIKRKILCLE